MRECRELLERRFGLRRDLGKPLERVADAAQGFDGDVEQRFRLLAYFARRQGFAVSGADIGKPVVKLLAAGAVLAVVQ